MMRALCAVFVCLSLMACSTNSARLPILTYPLADLRAERSTASNSDKSYVSIDVPAKAFEKIRTDLEHSEKVTLKSRGEAHITLITPPEMQKLRKKLGVAELNQLIQDGQVQKIPFKMVCVGRGQLRDMTTYYVVVDGEGLYQFRKNVFLAFAKKGGTAQEFNPELFYPHITVGFTARDLHLEEGVMKDASSCLYSLQGQ